MEDTDMDKEPLLYALDEQLERCNEMITGVRNYIFDLQGSNVMEGDETIDRVIQYMHEIEHHLMNERDTLVKQLDYLDTLSDTPDEAKE